MFGVWSHALCLYTAQDVLKSLESHQQVLQRIHKDRSVDGVPVPPDQLQDMAERWERQLPVSFGLKKKITAQNITTDTSYDNSNDRRL